MLQQLCKRYQESDSVSERLKLKSDIIKIVVNFVADTNAIREKYGVYTNYDFDCEDDKQDEYRISDIWDHAVEITSKDRECCEPYLVTFEEFENFVSKNNEYRKDLIATRIRELELDKKGYERQVKETAKTLEKLNKELSSINC